MSATSFSLTTFFRGLFSSESAPGSVDEPRSASRSGRQVPPADTSARSNAASFYCCYGVRQKANAYETDVAADEGSSPGALYMPDLDAGIQIAGGFLQPAGGQRDADGQPVRWHARTVRTLPGAAASTTQSHGAIEGLGALGDCKGIASGPLAAAGPSSSTLYEPLSGGRPTPSAKTLLTAQGLAKEVHGILSGGGTEAVKRESLAQLLQGASHDPQLVECLVLSVLASTVLKDAQKVYFLAHVARHYIDDGATRPRRPLSREAVLAITQGLRAHRDQWKDKTCYGQAFSHLYEGARHILKAEDLRGEKATLQEREFVASLRNRSGDFSRWAIDKLDERLQALRR